MVMSLRHMSLAVVKRSLCTDETLPEHNHEDLKSKHCPEIVCSWYGKGCYEEIYDDDNATDGL